MHILLTCTFATQYATSGNVHYINVNKMYYGLKEQMKRSIYAVIFKAMYNVLSTMQYIRFRYPASIQ